MPSWHWRFEKRPSQGAWTLRLPTMPPACVDESAAAPVREALRHRNESVAAPLGGFAATGLPAGAVQHESQLHSTRSRPVDLARYKAASARSRVLSVDSAE